MMAHRGELSAPEADPHLEVLNRQRAVAVDMEWISAALRLGLASCRRVALTRGGALAHMEEITVTLVSDRKIADLHRRFMGIPGATDVITFQHGEVVVSTQTAVRLAREHNTGFHGEILLYGVHGFLHLSGMDDVTAELRERMHSVQEQICADVIRSMARCAGVPGA
jgi:probable rRNA maturation factor